MKVSIVEDDRKLRQLKRGLTRKATLLLEFDGRQGLEAARRGGFDVLVVDVMVRGIEGFSLVRKLRAESISTPILLLSAKDAAEDFFEGLDSGGPPYLRILKF